MQVITLWLVLAFGALHWLRGMVRVLSLFGLGACVPFILASLLR